MTNDLLFNPDFNPPRQSKRYYCRHCRSKKTVNWIESTCVWMCSVCGKIDRPRTEREGSCSKNSSSTISRRTKS